MTQVPSPDGNAYAAGMAANCTVTIAHSRSRDLAVLCRTADILIATVGRPEMIRDDWVEPEATVIGVGINRIPDGDGTRLVGDAAFAEAGHAGAITPVPGGVGPRDVYQQVQRHPVSPDAECTRQGSSGDG